MKSFLWKMGKLLIVIAAILICVRIIWVNHKPSHTDIIAERDELVEYDGLQIGLGDVRAVLTDEFYRVEFELSIKNVSNEVKEFGWSRMGVYCGALHNGVMSEDWEQRHIQVDPDTTKEILYYCSIPKNSVGKKSWEEIQQKSFKIMLLGYEKNVGWEINPEEYVADVSVQEKKDSKKIEILSEADFYRMQKGNIGETKECLWDSTFSSQVTTAGVTVKEVKVSKEVSESWKYIFEDIEKYSAKYSGILSKLQQENKKICNDYTAIEVQFEIDVEEEIIFFIDHLQLHFMNVEMFTVKDVEYNPYIGVFGECDTLQFLKFDALNNIFTETDDITRMVKLNKGKNRVVLVYIVPDVCTESMERLYIAKSFIGTTSDNKERHSFSNAGILIQLSELQ